MRFSLAVFGLIVFSVSVGQCQDAGTVRQWTGNLGRSQFGIFSKDGLRLVYTDGNDAIIVDAVDGTNAVRLSGHTKPVSIARFSGDGKKIVTVAEDETIRSWDPQTGKQLGQVIANTGGAPGSLLTVSQNGNVIGFSTADDHVLRLMDLGKSNERQKLTLDPDRYWWRCLSPDGRFAMSNGYSNTTTIWDTTNGTTVAVENGHHNYCGQFSHDGKRAILAGGYIWDVWDIRHKAKLTGGTVTGGHIYSIASSPIGERLLTGLADGTVWLWDLKTGKEKYVFRGHTKPLSAVVFSPDMKFAVSQDNSRSIIIWRLPK